MAERRQAVRREPIEVEVRGTVYKAEPLPWLVANEIGNIIVTQNAEAANNAVRMYATEDNIPQLEAALKRNVSDYGAFLIKGYPGTKKEEYDPYDADELFELSKAMLEVNHLDYLINLIDPNSASPTESGGTATPEVGAGQKTSFTPDSFSTESPTPQSE